MDGCGGVIYTHHLLVNLVNLKFGKPYEGMDIMPNRKNNIYIYKEKWKEKGHSARIRLQVPHQSHQNPRSALEFIKKHPCHQYCIQMVFLSQFSPAREQGQPLLDEHAFCFSMKQDAHHSHPSGVHDKLIPISQRNSLSCYYALF